MSEKRKYRRLKVGEVIRKGDGFIFSHKPFQKCQGWIGRTVQLWMILNEPYLFRPIPHRSSAVKPLAERAWFKYRALLFAKGHDIQIWEQLPPDFKNAFRAAVRFVRQSKGAIK